MNFNSQNRREFLQLVGMGVGGVVFASGLGQLSGCATSRSKTQTAEDFYFLQLSDTHWGFKGPPNPEADVTLKNTVSLVNALQRQPDFIVFTGDLTHTTDDGDERRKRLGEFNQIVKGLSVKNMRFMAGEHDAALDAGAAYQEFFGELHYTFDHKGIHFSVLGLDDQGWRRGDRLAAKSSERHCLLRSHPPGASPDDRPDCPPLRPVADFSFARAGSSAKTRAAAVGASSSQPGAWLPGHR